MIINLTESLQDKDILVTDHEGSHGKKLSFDSDVFIDGFFSTIKFKNFFIDIFLYNSSIFELTINLSNNDLETLLLRKENITLNEIKDEINNAVEYCIKYDKLKSFI